MNESDDLRSMFDRSKNKTLGAWDFVAGDVTLEIVRIKAGVVEGEKGRKDKVPLMYLRSPKREIERPLALNKTNTKILASLFGTTSAKGLVGKRITLYATTCRGAEGGQVDCVRIRPTAPKAGAASSELPDVPVDPEMRANQVAQMEPARDREPGEEG